MLLSYTITAALFALAVVLGFRLGRHAKPYPPDLLILHIAPFFFIVLGIGQCMSAIDAILPATSVAMSVFYLAGPALIALFISGVVLCLSKRKVRAWVIIHKVAMYCLGLSIVASFVLAMVRW